MSSLLDTYYGNVLLAKAVVVVVMIVIIYANNLHFGRNDHPSRQEKRLDELKAIRKPAGCSPSSASA